jgi:filamentous hemagglutinin family protein
MSPKHPILLILLCFFITFPPALAQITTDGTLGKSASLSGPDYSITADLGKQAGANLFHSFSQFDIGTGETATFTGPNSVENIISRVTGGSESRIDGILRSEIPGANFFLLNPAGVFFGPHSSLDINGSFHVSTADYLKLGEDGRFDARYPENDVLKTAPPSAFGFLGENSGAITFQGSGSKLVEDYWGLNGISVPEGETLSVIGGEIHMRDGLLLDTYPAESRLRAPGGQINLMSLASPGEVPVNSELSDISAFGEYGDISLSRGSAIDVSADKSGGICIRGGKFVISGQSSVTSLTGDEPGGEIDIGMSSDLQINEDGHIMSASFGTGKGGDISISADLISIADNAFIFADSGMMISETENIGGKGDGGNITLDANRLEITGGLVSTTTLDSGKAGNITISADIATLTEHGVITADNGIVIANQGGMISSGTIIGGKGISGDITLNVSRLEMDKSAVSSNNYGEAEKGGKISITAKEHISIAGSETEEPEQPLDKFYGIASQARGSGDGGHIAVETAELKLTRDAVINGQTYGSGTGGNISLNLSRLDLSDGGTITTSTRGAGHAGEISIIADESVHISGSGEKLDKSRIYTATHSGGTGGKLNISTSVLRVGEDGEIVTKTLGDETWDGNTLPDGRAGDIELNADRAELKDGGIITAGSESDGDAGNISINIADTFTIDNAQLETSTQKSDGGNINIETAEMLHLSNGGSINTSVNGGEGDGGNIAIGETSAPESVVLKDSEIIADAHGGDGGDIHIVADGFLQSSFSTVSASSDLGIDGNIYIESPDSDISSSLVVLSDDYLDATRWMKTPCKDRSGEKISRLIQKKRDAMPTSFEDWQASPPVPLEESEKNFFPLLLKGAEFYNKGDLSNAAASWEEALPLLDPEDISYLHTLVYLAQTYQALGHHQKAVSGLSKVSESSDSYRNALNFTTLGDIYLSLGDRTKAKTYLEKSLAAARLADNPRMLAMALNNRANLLAAEKDDQGALAAYQESLDTSGIHPELKAAIRINIARLSLQISGYQAQNMIQPAEAAFREIQHLPDSHSKARMLISLSLLAQKIQNHPASLSNSQNPLKTLIWQSLNDAKQIAGALEDYALLSCAYGYLGRLYEAEGRYEDAMRLTRNAIFLAQQGYRPEILYRWQWQAGRLFKSMNDIENSLTAYQAAISTLNPIRTEFFGGYRGKKPSFYENIKAVYLGLTDLLMADEAAGDSKTRESKLVQARDTMELLKTAELEDFFQDECLIAAEENTELLNVPPPHTAVLYPILLPDRLELLLTLPAGIQQISVPVTSESLRKETGIFRRRLQEGSARYKYFAERLYRYLISPIEPELSAQKIDTLIVAPDDILRLIPFSALISPDDQRFLIEKYALVTVPAMRLTDTDEAETGIPDILLAGLSEGVPQLPHVPEELENIRDMTGGKILLNENFTADRLTEEFKGRPYSHVLMATHGVFGESPEKTFLKTYQGKLTMDQLETLILYGRFREQKTDLLTLSACETAMSDERSALGLAGIAVKAGVKNALATLWSVDDKAASLTVTEFYRQLLNAGTSKEKALQNAQKTMIAQPKYSYPVCWAPFLLIRG